MQLKAVVFDFGNVISLPTRHERVLGYAEQLEIPQKDFLAAYRAERHLFDQGAVGVWEYWQRVLDFVSFVSSQVIIHEFVDLDIKDWTQLNQPLLKWHRTLLGKGYRTGILSNIPSYYADYFRNHFSWLNSFDTLTFSCDAGSIKPEPEIYQVCLKSLDVEATQVLFLDDLEVNVEAARKTGMHSEVFVSFDETIPFIKIKYGV